MIKSFNAQPQEDKTTNNSSSQNEEEEKDKLQIEIIGEQYKEYDFSYKLIVVGNSGVGKSCLSLKSTKGVFEEEFISTIGFEFFSFFLKINNQVIKLQIWDTCGQEVYRSLISNFYRNSSVAILVYAINDEKSFEDLDVWNKQIKTHASPDCKIFLIGNKADLENERKISYEQGKKCKENNKFDLFMETSAKTGLNAQKVFITAAKELYLQNLKYLSQEEKDAIKGNEQKVYKSISKTIELNKIGEEQVNEGCC